MAELLGEAPSTVQSWKTAERIPAAHQPNVLEKAREHRIEIVAEDVIFPMGRNSAAPDHSASATISGENIRTGEEAGHGHPFTKAQGAASPSTCSSMSSPPAETAGVPASAPSIPASSRSRSATLTEERPAA